MSDNLFITSRNPRVPTQDPQAETSVTAQIPLSVLSRVSAPDIELRFAALCQLLVGKGIVTADELTEALKKAEGGNPPDS